MQLKILVIRLSSIGDIILTTPTIRALATQLNAEVHLLTKATYKDLLSANPYIRKQYLLEKDIKAIIPSLIDEQYNCIIDLHHNWRSKYITYKLGIKTYTTHKDNLGKLLLIYTGINKLAKIHQAERHINAVKNIGIHYDYNGLDFFIDPQNQVKVEFNNNVNEPYLALSLGATHYTKKLPLEKLIRIIQELTMPIVLLGATEDLDTGSQIVDFFKTRKDITIMNGVGKWNIQQSASVIFNAQLVFAYDTGLMHIAAALDKDIVTVWGATVKDFGFYPLYKKNSKAQFQLFEVSELSCRPCSRAGSSSCPKDHFKCMNNQDIQGIAKAINNHF